MDIQTIVKNILAGAQTIPVPRGTETGKFIKDIRAELISQGVTGGYCLMVDRNRKRPRLMIWRREKEQPFCDTSPIDAEADVARMRGYQDGTAF